MRVASSILAALCAASVAGILPARAQTGPVIVVPGKAGVPVTMNGMIVDGAVIYGDWGLARPGHGDLVIEGPVAYSALWDARGYYPATGRSPFYGRHEIIPKGARPRPASFSRSWSAESESRRPVTEYPPFDPPPVMTAPKQRQRHR